MTELKVRILKTYMEKIIGLTNSSKAYPVLLKTRFGIHTFGMKFPIDILILDKNNKVVKLFSSLPKNKIFVWNPKYDMVVELPERFISVNKIQQGDMIRLIFE